MFFYLGGIKLDKSIIAEALNIVNLTKHEISKKEMFERLLNHYKMIRKEKGLNNIEANAQHLNVYEKRGITVSSILEYLLNKQWVVELEDEALRLTEEGRAFLETIYTNNNSPEYLEFKECVSRTAAEYNEPTLEEQQIMKLFWRNWSLDLVEECYFKMPTNIDIGHNSFQEATGITIPEDSMVLHIRPTLFLDWEDYDKDIHLTINGIDGPEIEFKRPYPNKRYVIAKLKGINGEKLSEFGFYALIQPKKDFPEEKTITYRWQVGDKSILHHIHLKFQSEFGNIYSTSQRTSRSSSIPTQLVRTCTGIEDVTKYCEEYQRDIKVVFALDSNMMTIHEKITLTSIPLHLHYF